MENKVHPREENWNIDTHTYAHTHRHTPKLCLFFSTKFLPMLFNMSHGKMQQNSSYEMNLEYRYPYFFQVIPPPIPSNFHPIVCYIPLTVYVFIHDFSIAWLNSLKRSFQMGRTWNIDINTFLKVWVISSPLNSSLRYY